MAVPWQHIRRMLVNKDDKYIPCWNPSPPPPPFSTKQEPVVKGGDACARVIRAVLKGGSFGGDGGLGPKGLCTKNGLTRFSRL